MSNGNCLVEFVYSDMERFSFNRLVYASRGLDISQGVFQKISTRQKKSQKGSLLPGKHSVRIE